MRPVLVAALAVAGLLIGWGLRIPVARLAVRRTQPGRPDEGRAARADPPPDASSPGHQARAEPPPATPRPRRPPRLALELVTAAVLGGLAARLHPGLVLAAACWLAVCGVALAWIDASVQRLPDALTGAAYAGTVALLLPAAATSGNWHDLLRAVAGGLALAAILAAIAVISRSALGLGDAKLAASLGTMLAWSGWVTLARGLVAAVLLGAVYALVLLASRRATPGQRAAFGPFMVAGALLAILAGGA
jgi:leader peptidase (prepilin peptidase) / N-methyltransferase